MALLTVKSCVGPIELDRHHAQFGAGSFGDLVDRRTAAGKICHHLRGDIRRIGRDAARGNAMIGSEHRDGYMVQPRQFAALPARQPDRQLFQTAEAARRLRQNLLPARGSAGGAHIALRQVATKRADVV
jgi:hypothetical protein